MSHGTKTLWGLGRAGKLREFMLLVFRYGQNVKSYKINNMKRSDRFSRLMLARLHSQNAFFLSLLTKVRIDQRLGYKPTQIGYELSKFGYETTGYQYRAMNLDDKTEMNIILTMYLLLLV